MLRDYDDVVNTDALMGDPDLQKFATALRAQIRAEYEEVFGLGEVVAKRREELHLSQMELADQTGVSQADISRLERGKGNPTLETMKKLLGALQLKLAVQRDEPHGTYRQHAS